jgi:hypothetical protein
MSDGGKRGIVLQNGCGDGNSAQIDNGQLKVKDSGVINVLQKILDAIIGLPKGFAHALSDLASIKPFRVWTQSFINRDLYEIAINFASSGDNTVIGSYGGPVKVYKLFLVAATATTITFKSGASVSLTGAITLNSGGSVVLDVSDTPWFTTQKNDAFVINSSVASQISGRAYFK